MWVPGTHNAGIIGYKITANIIMMLAHHHQMQTRISKIDQVWVILEDFLDKFLKLSMNSKCFPLFDVQHAELIMMHMLIEAASGVL